MPEKILVVEDEENMRFMIVEALTNRGYEVKGAVSAEEALEEIEILPPDLILMDIRLPGMSGLEAMSRVKEQDPLLPIIVITALGSREVALEAIKMGAYDFFPKPFKLAEVEVVVNRALEKRRLQRELHALRETLDERHRFENIIMQSDKMQEVLRLVKKVASTEVTVLITGDTGTGKELVAETIHHLSRRRYRPFIKLNCAAIPEGLLESELFGHEKGAFTGAIRKKAGKFELADQGSIFLDEIGDMSLPTQAKVLRVLEEKELERVGGTNTLKVDVRVIAATNQDLSRAMKEKRFRDDLYFRLSVFPIQLPPLSERKEDIPLLADHFLHEANLRLGKDIHGISGDAMELLMEYQWPGNIRELRNIIERAVTLADGQIITTNIIDFSFKRSGQGLDSGIPEAYSSLRETVEEVERQLILNALKKCGGIQIEAAKLLGITEKNLWKKIKKHKIDVKELKTTSYHPHPTLPLQGGGK